MPDRKVAPISLPVRSWIVRKAKSRFSAFWLPWEFPKPATLSCLVLNIKFLNLWLSSTKRWSMPIILKSTVSSVRSLMSCSKVLSFTSRFSLRLYIPLIIARETSLPCFSNCQRLSSTSWSSSCKMLCCTSGDCGIILNWSWVRITQSQSLFLMSPKIRKRFWGVKSSLPG